MEYVGGDIGTNGQQNQALLPPPTTQYQSRERLEHFYQPAEEQIELELTKHSVVTTKTTMEDENELVSMKQQRSSPTVKEGVETSTHTTTVVEMQGATAPAGTKASQTETHGKRHNRYQHSSRRTEQAGDASNLSAGLNLLDRDEKNINKHVELMFEDIMAEPDGIHSFDFIFSSSFLTFTMCRNPKPIFYLPRDNSYWVYRVLTCILAVPLAVVWALVFALLTITNNWIVVPSLRVLGVFFTWIQLLVRLVVHNVFDPVFESIGKVFYNVRYTPVTPSSPPPPGGYPPTGGYSGSGGYPYQYQPLPTSAPPTAATTTAFNPTVIGYGGQQPTQQHRVIQTQLM